MTRDNKLSYLKSNEFIMFLEKHSINYSYTSDEAIILEKENLPFKKKILKINVWKNGVGDYLFTVKSRTFKIKSCSSKGQLEKIIKKKMKYWYHFW